MSKNARGILIMMAAAVVVAATAQETPAMQETLAHRDDLPAMYTQMRPQMQTQPHIADGYFFSTPDHQPLHPDQVVQFRGGTWVRTTVDEAKAYAKTHGMDPSNMPTPRDGFYFSAPGSGDMCYQYRAGRGWLWVMSANAVSYANQVSNGGPTDPKKGGKVVIDHKSPLGPRQPPKLGIGKLDLKKIVATKKDDKKLSSKAAALGIAPPAGGRAEKLPDTFHRPAAQMIKTRVADIQSTGVNTMALRARAAIAVKRGK
jgi:hypothetical protein